MEIPTRLNAYMQSVSRIFAKIRVVQISRSHNEYEDVSWDVVPCSLVETDRRFRGPYCLYYHPRDDTGIKQLKRL
jgi:hypothetical protein